MNYNCSKEMTMTAEGHLVNRKIREMDGICRDIEYFGVYCTTQSGV